MSNKADKELIPFTKSTLPILEFNFDDMKKELTTEMDKYSGIVVTLETLKADKKLAQELKAKGAEFNKQRLEKVKAISEPIVKFTEQMNELKNICVISSELISEQVKVFEKDTLATITTLLLDTLNEYRDVAHIDAEFRVCQNTENLVKLGAVTTKGALNKGSKDKLTAIVTEELALQGKINYRLLQLESESHKANLTTPLVRLNVEAFLFSDDDIYSDKLSEVIQSELQRQELAISIADDKAKAETNVVATELRESANVADRLAERFSEANSATLACSEGLVSLVQEVNPNDFQNAPSSEYDNYADAMMQEQASHQPEPEIQLKDGHVMCIATATFKVSVPNQVTEEMVQDKLIKMMSDAGIASLDSVQVRKL